MDNIIENLKEALQHHVDEKTNKNSQRFFKEKMKYYGVKTPTVRKISKEFFGEIRNRPKSVIFNLCETLWQSGYLEEAFVACHWSYYLHKQYKPEDFQLFEKWIDKYVTNWATCDTFCNHSMGTFIEMYPEYLERLKGFAKSENRWMRRAAAVSLIVPARRGKFLKDIFEIADLVLMDKDDMVQKGYGWMLKVASQQHQHEVYKYVLNHKTIMPRTALRYAIEKMPKEMRAEAMKK